MQVGVLDTDVTNVSELRARLDERDEALVVCSSRAVEAFSQALNQSDRAARDGDGLTLFAVGPSTRDALRRCAPAADILGAEQAGTGALLARFVSQHFGDARPRLLQLTGDKSRDDFVQAVRADGFDVEQLEVYATAPSRALGDDLASMCSGTASVCWIAFFSPSSADACVARLRELDILARARIAAIGPTTRDHLEHVVGVRVHATASKPDADALALAMRTYEDEGEG